MGTEALGLSALLCPQAVGIHSPSPFLFLTQDFGPLALSSCRTSVLDLNPFLCQGTGVQAPSSFFPRGFSAPKLLPPTNYPPHYLEVPAPGPFTRNNP